MRRHIRRASNAGCALLFVAFLSVTPALRAQDAAGQDKPMAADASPAFLVAAIRPSDPSASGGWAFPSEGRHVSCANATVADIMAVAYGIHRKQIVNAPDWITKERYDISGVPDVPGIPNLRQTQEMYQKLLAERFHLSFHREVRQIPVYAITVAKGGPLLSPAKPGETINTGNSGSGGQRTLRFTDMSMADFALNMNFYEDRPVIDSTGLRGRYDFTLKWTYDVTSEAPPDAPPSLFTAIREQLGLRVDAVKGPAEVLVFDRVERPSVD